MTTTRDGPDAANVGADGTTRSSWAAGPDQGSAGSAFVTSLCRRSLRHEPLDPGAGWTDAELIAYLAALRWLTLVASVDVRWALPDDVRDRLADA